MPRKNREQPHIHSSIMATRPGRMLFIGVVVSLVVHVYIGYATYNKPLGYVDVSQLQTTTIPIRIKRASYDQYLEPGQIGEGPGIGEPVAHAAPPSAADLSKALLQEAPSPAPSSAQIHPDAPEPPPDMNQLPPAPPAKPLAIDLPAFKLPERVLDQVAGKRPSELTYQSTEQVGFGSPSGANGNGSNGDASLDAGGPGGAGAGSAQARKLLAQSGLIPGVVPSQVTRGGGRSALDDLPVAPSSPVSLPLQGPAIDFARLALQDTTHIKIPEHLDQDFSYAVTRYDPDQAGGKAGYFRVDIRAMRSLHKLHTMPKDVVFLIDTSSSIPQAWVKQVVAGVEQSLWTFNPDDRFNIVLFNERPSFFSAGKPEPATHENIERAIVFLNQAQSRGFTDVNAALSRLLVRDVSIRRVYELILISDGQPTRGVISTRDLINLITRDNNLEAGIYCVGIGRKPNHQLLNYLAYRNKGFSIFVDDKAHAAGAIRSLMSRLRYPLIKNLRVHIAGRTVHDFYPLHLPDIHQGERFSLFGRYDVAAPFTVQITGESSGKNVDFTFTRDLSQAPLGDRTIAHDWAFWKLHHLYSEIIRQGKLPSLMNEIDRLREQYDLKTLY